MRRIKQIFQVLLGAIKMPLAIISYLGVADQEGPTKTSNKISITVQILPRIRGTLVLLVKISIQSKRNCQVMQEELTRLLIQVDS